MSLTVRAFGNPRFSLNSALAVAQPSPGRSTRLPAKTGDSGVAGHVWLVDVAALARCRTLFAQHGSMEVLSWPVIVESHESWMDVPPSYDQFCRAHFASVKRLHPELSWDDACPAYAIALSAHAVLCEGLDEAREKQLEQHWPRIRGRSTLAWPQARTLIADGCSALARLDPLAMHR